ncbi:MAG: pyridoxamine 5'-phosphate oxidase family protein [Pseudomonadota bacterium]
MTNPIRPTDDDARQLARTLIEEARFGAIAVLGDDGAPLVTRIAIARDQAGAPLTLISSLSQHTQALSQRPHCSLLVGEPGDKGDPLTHPRLTIQADAVFVERPSQEHDALRDNYLTQVPKAKLYIDFGDFSLVRLVPREAFLNGGFGKAYTLTAADLKPAAP